jgi:hypothetical protein
MLYILVCTVQLESMWWHLRCIFVFYLYNTFGVLNFSSMCRNTIKK